MDQAERHDFLSRFLLINSPFHLPCFFRREEKGEKITKVIQKMKQNRLTLNSNHFTYRAIEESRKLLLQYGKNR